MNELKPCPFCGGEPCLISIQYDRRYFVVCEKCGYKSAKCWDEEEAIETWNMRVNNE